MAAGLGFKTFTTGEVLTAADTNGYLMQGINVFASTAARDAAITSPQEGQFAFTKDTNGLWYYDGAAWVASGATGDIEGVTAGIGISGGGTSGTVTVTNSMATAIDAKGDLVVGTAADTFSRLAVGADGTTIVADSSTATGLKWATASSGALTKVTSASFDNVATTSTTFDGVFTSTYDNYMVVFNNMRALTNTSNLQFQLRNAGSTQSTAYYGNSTVGSTVTTTNNATSFNIGQGFSDSTQQNSYVFTVYRNTNRLSWSFQGMTRNGNGGVVGGGFSDSIAANGSDGFILSASSGNITGKATIYGLAI